VSSSAIRAGAAYIELTLRDGISRPLHNASVALKDFGHSVAWQGAKIAAMGAAVSAPLAAMAHSFARSAVESGRFATRRDASNVQAYVGALLRLSNAMQAFRDAVGSAVLPLLSRWPSALARVVERATAWVRANRGLVQSIARLASIVVATGTAIAIIGRTIATVGSVFGVLAGAASFAATVMAVIGSVFTAILSPIGLVIAGVVALGGYLLYTSGVGQQALDWLSGAFGGLLADASEAMDGIYAALANGDIESAAEILWLGLKLQWEKGVNALNQIWINAKDFFLQVWSNASFTAAGYFIDAWALVESGWVETIAFMESVLDGFFVRFRKGWGSITDQIAKGLLYVQGQLDPTLDVAQAQSNVTEDRNRINKGLDQGLEQRGREREARRQNRRAEIEQSRQAAQANLGQDKAAGDNQRQQQFNQQRRDAEGKVDKARQGFKKAVDDAKSGEPPPKEPPPSILMPMMQEQKKIESKGTFNALAARSLGSSTLADRTAKATEKAAELLKKIEDNTKEAAVFA